MSATAAKPLKSVAKAPDRIPLAKACAKLGISKSTWHAHWRNTFTPYTTDGGKHLISEDELLESLRYTDPKQARGAVMNLRGILGRL